MKDFTKGNPTTQILLFSLPMLIGSVFQQFYNMADAVVVGRYVSSSALAAVGTAGTIINFMLAIMGGLATGASVMISQFYGAGEQEKLRRTVSTSVVALLALIFVISTGGIAIMPAFMRALNVPADIFDDTLLYLRILLAGMVFMMIYNLFTAYLRALGDTKRPLYILMLSTILNIFLDLLFVLKFDMGVAGVAWATLIAQAIAGIACYAYVVKRVPLLTLKNLAFDPVLFRSLLRYSVPAAIQLSLTSFASLTIVRLVNSFGSVEIAGYTAAIKLDQLALMPLMNLSLAVSTFVAQNMGAHQEERAKQGLRSGALIMGITAVVVSSFVMIFGRPLISFFVDENAASSAQIIQSGSSYLMVIAFFYILHAMFFAFNGFFRGVGDAVVVMALTITSLTIRAGSAHFLVHFGGLGIEAVAWSIPIGWGLCTLFCLWYYKKRLWQGKAAV